jgi:hypothetical protein
MKPEMTINAMKMGAIVFGYGVCYVLGYIQFF